MGQYPKSTSQGMTKVGWVGYASLNSQVSLEQWLLKPLIVCWDMTVGNRLLQYVLTMLYYLPQKLTCIFNYFLPI